MKNRFIFTVFAQKKWKKLDCSAQDRIQKKLKTLVDHPDIQSVLEHLVNFEPATHRLRIGDYRVILKHEDDQTFLVLDVGHRREIYK